jgi:hypothetical protein
LFPDEIGPHQQCFAVYAADASAAPEIIVAAYTNSTEAVIRVLRRVDTGFAVVAEPQADLDLSGSQCDVILEDVDADGRNEIRVDFRVNRAIVSWLFRWDGQSLWNLTPTGGSITGYQMSRFLNADLVDVDHDGTKEIYVRPEFPQFSDDPVLPALLYRLSGDRYVEGTPLLGVWNFVETANAPETSHMTVTVPQGARGPYTLRLLNGLADRTARIAAAQVWMNSQEIFSPSDFARNVAVIERPLALGPENDLAVRLDGQSSGEILIVIESQNWETP